MKKLTKTLLCSAIALIIGTGSAFAKGRNKMNTGNKNMPGKANRMELRANDETTSKTALLGKIVSIDEKNGVLNIADADGKETAIIISPFTKIRINDEKAEKTVSDIKKGDWILYSLFNTETEKKIASRIYVKS
ncbi:MAG: hypothetical protein MJ185_08120 [Treponema sp.]|nr:hypothetical protein [Treponema sp.]